MQYKVPSLIKSKGTHMKKSNSYRCLQTLILKENK
jgi:hypothetical protein